MASNATSTNGTLFTFKPAAGRKPAGDVLLVPLVAKPQPPLELVARADRLCDDRLSELLGVKAVRDEVGHLSHTTSPGGVRRILVISLGDADKLGGEEIRRAAASAARWLIAERLHTAVLWADGLDATAVDDAAAEWATGMGLAGFRFAEHREPDDKAPARIQVHLHSSDPGRLSHVMNAVRRATTLTAAVNYTRRLAHQPANIINPRTLADEAGRLARAAGFRFTLLDERRLRTLGMNGLVAVGQGAHHPACLIQLEYRGAPGSRATTVLVGKAITFDTGGYSIKPAAGLEALKFDKSGGATVLGVLKAAADLKLACNLVGLVATAENAISDRAYRPGDIVRMASGKTVEVITTDAEGRLILADALWYAQEKLKPTALIDIATLTGGVGVALGTCAAGLMANDDDLAADLGEAGRQTNERLWRLPLWDEYRDLIKGTDADIKNAAAKRDAHAIVGGMFLKEFIRNGMSWAHLDIAAVANPENGQTPTGKGASGFGVRLLVAFLRARGA